MCGKVQSVLINGEDKTIKTIPLVRKWRVQIVDKLIGNIFLTHQHVLLDGFILFPEK